jgi:uncharacterized membrane protein YagU involved in acid resistance
MATSVSIILGAIIFVIAGHNAHIPRPKPTIWHTHARRKADNRKRYMWSDEKLQNLVRLIKALALSWAFGLIAARAVNTYWVKIGLWPHLAIAISVGMLFLFAVILTLHKRIPLLWRLGL